MSKKKNVKCDKAVHHGKKRGKQASDQTMRHHSHRSLVILGLNIIPCFDGIFDLHSNVPNTTGIICIEDWNLAVALWLIVEEQFQVNIDSFVLEKNDIHTARLESSVDAESMIGYI